MRFFRAMPAELACVFLFTTLALAAPNSAAFAQSDPAASHLQTRYERTVDPAAPGFPAELVRFARPLGGGSLRPMHAIGIPPMGYAGVGRGPRVDNPPKRDVAGAWCGLRKPPAHQLGLQR
jgi:hypothetical protein